MRIWKIGHEDYDYFNLYPVDKAKWTLDYIRSFDGSSKAKEWTQPCAAMEDPERKLPPTDFPGFYCLPFLVFSERATTLLRPLIEHDAEFLPIDASGQAFYFINVTSVLDCVDAEKSTCRRFKSTGRIMKYLSLAFRADVIKGHHLFRLPHGPKYYYVTDEFKELVEHSGLTGFSFRLIWEDPFHG